MNPIICDTNVFIKLFLGDSLVIAELSKIGNSRILMPSISVMELLVGMQNKIELQQMKKKIKHFNIIHLNEAASQKSIELIADYRLSHGLMIPDALIGAMALTYDLELFTYNVKDFRFMPNIKLYPLP
ncbi:MAG: type II toxin-antitoxin system VapC family toxin [Saprospiraceae bacterium]|nr:type II toxin-antitoxin system VapC family toxin [Saprospiraceae bacterium]